MNFQFQMCSSWLLLPRLKAWGYKPITPRSTVSKTTSARVSYDLRNLTEVCRDIATDNPALDLGEVQSVLSAILHDRLFQLLEKSTDVTDINKLIDAISKFSALEFKRQNLARDQQLKYHRVDLNIVSPARLQPANAVNISCDPPAALPQISKPGSDRPDSEPV